jgi:hypothetical protein
MDLANSSASASNSVNNFEMNFRTVVLKKPNWINMKLLGHANHQHKEIRIKSYL